MQVLPQTGPAETPANNLNYQKSAKTPPAVNTPAHQRLSLPAGAPHSTESRHVILAVPYSNL